MKKTLFITFLLMIAAFDCLAALTSPILTHRTNDLTIETTWTCVPWATGYALDYAPYPYEGPESIGSIDLGAQTSFFAELWEGAHYYIAVRAYNEQETSPYSNIELFEITGTSETDIFGLIANYSFDEVFGNIALDGTSNEVNGTIVEASRVKGKIGNGLLFVLGDSYVRIADRLYFDEGLITIETWIKPYAMDEGEVYRIIGDEHPQGFYLQIRGSRLEVLHNGRSYHYGSISILPNVWTHIAFTADGRDIITYINGIEDARTDITLPIQHMSYFRIGSKRDSPAYREGFLGIIDELRVWDIARSENEIIADFEEQLIVPQVVSVANPFLSAFYNFDELSGNIALDTSGNSHDGLITAASRVEGKIGNGLLFGLDDSNVEIEDIIDFDEGLITIETWIKPYEMNEGEVYRIIGNYHNRYLSFQIRGGKLEILYNGRSYHYGSISILPNVWTHIAFTADGRDIITYINGIEDARTNITLPLHSLFYDKIGATRDSPAYREEFPGIIDEMRIWDGIRTSNEIYEYYVSTN